MEFKLLPDGYEPPSVKLDMKLRAYNKVPTLKTPVLKGYMRVPLVQLKAMMVLAEANGGAVNMSIAVWKEREEGGWMDCSVEYREYNVPAPVEPQTYSHWY